MEIIIDNYEYWNMPAMKYWSHPKTYDTNKRKEETKHMCICGDYLGARKYDGAWNMLIKDMEGNFHLRSRTESVNGGYVDKAEWIPWITNDLSELPNGTVLLGEICFPNNEGSRKITSVLNCLKDKCIARQEVGEKLHYYVFDVLAYKGKNLINIPFEKRVEVYLEYELLDILKDNNYVFMANYKRGQELWDMLGEVLNAGGEGLVITHKDCKYLPGKRTARMTLKIKKEINQTIDAFLTGKYKPATREYKGKEIETWSFWENLRTGERSNECMFDEYVNGGPWEPVSKAYYYGWATSIELGVYRDGVIVPIGYVSGITDEVKDKIANNNAEMRNKVVEVTAMEIEHIGEDYSLRHAKIVCWRTDKTAEECTFDQIAN